MDYIIDATNQKLGRLASQIAVILQGKQSASYDPRLEGKDKIIVKNTHKLTVSGRKGEQKVYYHHTGYMGHLRGRSFKQEFAKSPGMVLRRAVFNMLPKNRLRARRLKRLIIER